MGYVPHTTHLCQGLDVAVFGAHKVHWSEECEKHECKTGHTIQKQDFLLVHSRAILRTFKKETILSAWEKTGLRPYNPNIITPQMLAPSTITSSHTQQLFPIEQPSPVRHVVKCMHDWLHTNSSTVTPPPIAPAAPLELGPNMIINPALLEEPAAPSEPSAEYLFADKVMASLKDTSAAFITNPSQITSSDKLPLFNLSTIPSCALIKRVAFALMPTSQEEWENIQAGVIDVCNRYDSACGQIVLQNGHNIGLRKQLYTKEHKKKKSRAQAMLGHKPILTADEFVEAVAQDRADRVQAAVDKQERAVTRVAKKKWKAAGGAWKKKAIADQKAKRCAQLNDWEVEKREAREYGWHQPPKPKAGKRESTPEEFCTFIHEDWVEIEPEGVEGRAIGDTMDTDSETESFFIP